MPTTRVKSKAAQVYAHVRGKIASGEYKPGEALPTQRELSHSFRVSENTASVAMGRLVHDGLVVRKAGLGSFVNSGVQAAVSVGEVHFILQRAVPSQRERPATLALIEDFSHACDQKGYVPMWHHLPHTAMLHPESLLPRFRGARAAIGALDIPAVFLDYLARQDIPVVAVLPRDYGRQLRQALYPQLTFDRRATVTKAVEHLVRLGHRSIAYVGLAGSPARTSAFVAAVQQHDLSVPIGWIREFSRDDSSGWIRHVLGCESRPQAICCATEHVALYVEQIAIDSGVRIPEDVALVACDEGPEAVEAPVPITTVGKNLDEIYQRALEAVEQMGPGGNSADATAWDPVAVPVHLTVRRSCGSNPGVERET